MEPFHLHNLLPGVNFLILALRDKLGNISDCSTTTDAVRVPAVSRRLSGLRAGGSGWWCR